MGTVTRYVLSETLKAFLAAAIITTALMTLGGGLKEGVSKGLPPWLIAQIVPYLLPETLRFTLPGCLLFAVCLVFGRMSATNEVVALKSLGIAPMAIIWPVLALSALLSIGTFWLYDVCATWGRPGLRATLVESLADVAYGVLRAEGAFISDKFSIVVKGVDGRLLEEPVIVLPAEDDRPAITLVAREAELVTDSRSQLVRILARNGHLEVAGKGTFSFPDTIEQAIPLDQSGAADITQLSPAALGMASIPGQIQYEFSQLRQLSLQASASRSPHEVAALEEIIHQHRLRWWRLRGESHRRLANGFSCLCFALLGIPMAMWWRQADALSVFFICFLPILLVYYPLLVLGEQMSNKGTQPPGAIWLANVILCAAGIGLLRHVVRH